VTRTAHPALRAVVTPRPGDANLKTAIVTLPRSQFIDQSHINNPCTRVQFNVGACPANSILGHAQVFTPLLDKPLEGPVYFRSNGGDRLLPDVVLDLHGQIDLVQVGFVDSREGGGIRTRFSSVPDAPFSKFVLNLKGGKQGLLVNSSNLCAAPQRAAIRLSGQNGRVLGLKQVIKTSCGKRTKRTQPKK